MFAPTRLFLALRPNAAPGLIVAAAAVAVLFSSTPFLLPAVADRFGVSLGISALISTVQVAGFVGTTFVSARRLVPSRSLMRWAAIVSVAANAASALATAFAVLLVLRLLAGMAAGMLVWLAWTDAMKESGVMRDVAAVGPMSALIAAPVFGWLAANSGDRPVYLVLAAVSVPVIFLAVDFGDGRVLRRRMSPSRSNVVLLVSLGLLSMFGSSLFVFVASLGRAEIGMGPVAVALAYSLNAFSGLVGARTRPRKGSAQFSVLAIAGAVAVVAFVHHPVALYAGMAVWGFSFWLTVPDVLGQVAEWSLVPQERVGDAQAVLALGRAAGPLLGASLVGDGAFASLGLTATAGLVAAAMIIGGVARYRKGRVPPMVFS